MTFPMPKHFSKSIILSKCVPKMLEISKVNREFLGWFGSLWKPQRNQIK